MAELILKDNQPEKARFKQHGDEAQVHHRFKDDKDDLDKYSMASKYKDGYFRRLPEGAVGYTMPELTAEQLKEALDRLSSNIRIQMMADLQPMVDKIVSSCAMKKDTKIKLDNGTKFKVKAEGLEILPQDPVLKQFG